MLCTSLVHQPSSATDTLPGGSSDEAGSNVSSTFSNASFSPSPTSDRSSVLSSFSLPLPPWDVSSPTWSSQLLPLRLDLPPSVFRTFEVFLTTTLLSSRQDSSLPSTPPRSSHPTLFARPSLDKVWKVVPNPGRGNCLLHSLFPGEDPFRLRSALAAALRPELERADAAGVYARNTVHLAKPDALRGDLEVLREQHDRLLKGSSIRGGAASLDQLDARAFGIQHGFSFVHIYAFEDPAFDLHLPTGGAGPEVDVLYTSRIAHFERLELTSPLAKVSNLPLRLSSFFFLKRN